MLQSIKSLNLFKQVEGQGHPAGKAAKVGHSPGLEDIHERKKSGDNDSHDHQRIAESVHELHAFRSKLHDAKNQGIFDAGKMATQAPNTVKKFAAEHNIELTTLIERIAEGSPRLQIKAFRNEILQAKSKGTLDPDALANEAPGILKQYTARHNIDLTQMVSQIADQKSSQKLHIPGMGPGMFIKAAPGIHRTEYSHMENRMDKFLERFFHHEE